MRTSLGVRHSVAPALKAHTPVPPYQASDRSDGGVDLHVRPGQRLLMQHSDADLSARRVDTAPVLRYHPTRISVCSRALVTHA
jgi:hypothetical protein